VKYRLIIFDFDGTLADTFQWFGQVLDGATERFRLRALTSEDVERLRGCSARKIIKDLGIPAWKLPLLARHIRQATAEHLEQLRLFPGVDDLLRGLVQHGVVLSIVSSNSEENVRAILGPDTAKLISVYECGASLFGKAAKFKRALKQTGIDRSAALCIGDEIRDYEAAQKAGIAFGAVSWGYTHRQALEALTPDALFDRPEAIDEWSSGISSGLNPAESA
jgi:phosphoglycolate phosphatase